MRIFTLLFIALLAASLVIAASADKDSKDKVSEKFDKTKLKAEKIDKADKGQLDGFKYTPTEEISASELLKETIKNTDK